eukprot:TRINITY_DN17517_c0_g1_i1.p4 TRINITY_DN17517_c0_g1~~TRINITY_DN17517_c0_g1_i1.p4  ORF type:complete len:115 (+),score=20.56 TRINITY_DN17517_c0_g1_i1:768-1112(+)
MYIHLRDKVGFHLVYIAEAHATDEWPISYPTSTAQHKSVAEREDALAQFQSAYNWTIPSTIDDLDDTASTVLGAWPFRLYVGYKDRIVYQGMPEEYTYSITTLYERLSEWGVEL